MTKYECATCSDHVCREGIDCYDMAERAARLYRGTNTEEARILQAAAKVEAEGYMRWPRALEIVRFAEMARYSHLGVAFCIGLADEARAYVEYLSQRFEVSSVCCKVCGVSKSEFDLERVHPDNPDEVMCSPLVQAEVLNQASTDLNIIVGLCVGHDALFSRHSSAPVTTLIAKDRVLGHNPAAALYSRYWRKKLNE